MQLQRVCLETSCVVPLCAWGLLSCSFQALLQHEQQSATFQVRKEHDLFTQ